MSDLWALWAAYGFAFGALGLYLVHLWNETQRLREAETAMGVGVKKDGPDEKE
ncbi:MAG TPA: hypothetical protein VI893_05925 [Thermoplasmata archaeon]|nr:hypothetical protein [Thermoplasmata archaeon]